MWECLPLPKQHIYRMSEMNVDLTNYFSEQALQNSAAWRAAEMQNHIFRRAPEGSKLKHNGQTKITDAYYVSPLSANSQHEGHVSIGSTLSAAFGMSCFFVRLDAFALTAQLFWGCFMPSPLSAPLSLSELNDSLWLVLLRWLRFGDGLLSPDSSLSDTEESLLDFRLDLPVLPSLIASSSCLCFASHHICCRWTTSGYLACKYNINQLGSMFNYIPWSVNFTLIKIWSS